MEGKVDVIIRKAQKQDIPDILRINDLMNGVGYSTAEHIKNSLERNPNEIVLVAIHNDKAIGLICGMLKPSICYAKSIPCEVTELFVCEDYRRKGIASKLIKQLENEFDKNNTDEVILLTGKKNINAQKFYENSGYDVFERVVYIRK
jgi:ribosomal protein S18 acetylase RimI-like enzyme